MALLFDSPTEEFTNRLDHPEGWMQPRFVGKPEKFHLKGPTPRPANSACTVSKICGPTCQNCGCPAYFIEVEMVRGENVLVAAKNGLVYARKLRPRINRIICANCRIRSHAQGAGKNLFNCNRSEP